MKVKELIRELKKYPGDYTVGVAMHDNGLGEIAGAVCNVYEYDPEEEHDPEMEPEKGDWVVLGC